MTLASNISGPIARIGAVLAKEMIQMRRDRLTFGMMFAIPVMQLILFGFAINADPRDLPAVVIAEEQTPIVRTILQGFENSGYYKFIRQTDDPRQSAAILASGGAAFVITIPSGFTEDVLRGRAPSLLIEADASDPAATSNALGQAQTIVDRAIRHDLKGPTAAAPLQPPARVVIHRRYNPEGVTQYNIVPGLLGVILTMTLVMITGMAMTREAERGTIENLLAMPVQASEVMLGKITPYVIIGAVQTSVVLTIAYFLFGTPFVGSMALLLMGVAIFVIANLSIGFTFSTIARSQMQAMQLTFFFFLPSLLLSGFMFPFRGMPPWAQGIGEILPLTHFLRIVRGVMLKGATLHDLAQEYFALAAFTLGAMSLALLRYRRTLD